MAARARFLLNVASHRPADICFPKAARGAYNPRPMRLPVIESHLIDAPEGAPGGVARLTRRHALRLEGRAQLVEMRRDLYMDEDRYVTAEPGFSKLRDVIDGLLASLSGLRL